MNWRKSYSPTREKANMNLPTAASDKKASAPQPRRADERVQETNQDYKRK